MKIHIIAAALPPKLNGIGDYTALLSAELAKSETINVLTGREQTPDPIPGVEVTPGFTVTESSSYWDLVPIIEADKPDWVLLQYQPFAYGRWGLNLHLPKVMRQVKRRCPETKFALMMHEPFVPLVDARSALMTSWQRWQLWRLGRTADVMFCSIDHWARRFQRWFLGIEVVHLPVGSNIPLVPTTRAEARQRLGIPEATFVLGLFGTAHASRMLSRVKGAAEAVRRSGREVLVLYIGPHGEVMREDLSGIPSITDGPLPTEEISRRFAAMDVYLAPFTDGVSTRRTTLMTGLQHGAAIVGTRGSLTDPVFQVEEERALLLVAVNDPDALYGSVLRLAGDAPLREQLGREAQHLYDREFAWPQIAERLLDALHQSDSRRRLAHRENSRASKAPREKEKAQDVV